MWGCFPQLPLCLLKEEQQLLKTIKHWFNPSDVKKKQYVGFPSFWFWKWEHVSHHAGVDCGLLYVTSDAGHKGIPVFKVGVKISLQKRKEGRQKWRGFIENNWDGDGADDVCVCVYLVHDGWGRGFDAWLLVREGQLLQQVHIGQSILQGHVGRHGNKASLTQLPGLPESEEIVREISD